MVGWVEKVSAYDCGREGIVRRVDGDDDGDGDGVGTRG